MVLSWLFHFCGVECSAFAEAFPWNLRTRWLEEGWSQVSSSQCFQESAVLHCPAEKIPRDVSELDSTAVVTLASK